MTGRGCIIIGRDITIRHLRGELVRGDLEDPSSLENEECSLHLQSLVDG